MCTRQHMPQTVCSQDPACSKQVTLLLLLLSVYYVPVGGLCVLVLVGIAATRHTTAEHCHSSWLGLSRVGINKTHQASAVTRKQVLQLLPAVHCYAQGMIKLQDVLVCQGEHAPKLLCATSHAAVFATQLRTSSTRLTPSLIAGLTRPCAQHTAHSAAQHGQHSMKLAELHTRLWCLHMQYSTLRTCCCTACCQAINTQQESNQSPAGVAVEFKPAAPDTYMPPFNFSRSHKPAACPCCVGQHSLLGSLLWCYWCCWLLGLVVLAV